MEQLLLFAEPEEQILKREVYRLREQCEKIRKGQFAKLNALTQQVKDLQDEFDYLKKAICKPPKEEHLQSDMFVFARSA